MGTELNNIVTYEDGKLYPVGMEESNLASVSDLTKEIQSLREEILSLRATINTLGFVQLTDVMGTSEELIMTQKAVSENIAEGGLGTKFIDYTVEIGTRYTNNYGKPIILYFDIGYKAKYKYIFWINNLGAAHNEGYGDSSNESVKSNMYIIPTGATFLISTNWSGTNDGIANQRIVRSRMAI